MPWTSLLHPATSKTVGHWNHQRYFAHSVMVMLWVLQEEMPAEVAMAKPLALVAIQVEMLGQAQDLVWGYQPLQESTGAIRPKVSQMAMD